MRATVRRLGTAFRAMLMEEFVYRSAMPVPASDLFEWHARRGALERLTPPWERVRVVEGSGGVEDGNRVTLSVPFGPIRTKWVSRQSEVIPGHQFKDEQIEGPFPHWVHTHLMLPDGPAASILEDRIEYTAPLGAIGKLIASAALDTRLPRLFRFRHDTLRGDLVQHARYAGRPRLRIAITGAGGLIGNALVPFLTTGGHDVIRLVRRPPKSDDEVEWSIRSGIINPERLTRPSASRGARGRADAVAEGGGHERRLDAVIHLAGENVGAGRWTAARKERILRSRVDGTLRLAESLARLPEPPAALLCASGIDFYGARPGEVTEADPPGHSFLAEVVKQWEAAAAPAVRAGIRVSHLRMGAVLTPAGGALAAMLPIFKLGGGGRFGSGLQPMSWVSIDDVVGAFHHALQTETLWGPVNVTAPHPVTNGELTATLARVLSRPALLPAPAFALRLAVGEMAELLLSGSRVIPERLMTSGYEFRHAELEAALRHVLGR
jgi:uncharacterized protein